jgi:uncharacterized protein YndB with AHSA1/START domain
MPDILHRVGIRSSRQEVYDALTTRDGLAGWWTSSTEGESRVGGRLQFRFEHAGVEIGSFTMQVLELQPEERVVWQVVDGPAEWIDTRVQWDLRQDGDYAILLFRHLGWREPVEFMHHCSTKWGVFLMSLKALVETGEGAPNPHDIKIDNWN